MNPVGIAAAAVIPQGPPDPKARCRVCSGWGMQLVPFGGGGYPNEQMPCTLPDAIVAVGGVQIRADDGLPQYCCVYCVRQVEAAYRLRQLCQEADRALREMFRVKENEENVELVQVKVEAEDPLEMGGTESAIEGFETNEGASSSQHQEFVVKEELHIEDYGDGFVDEDNSMECDGSADEAADSGEPFYDRVPVEKFCCCGCKKTFDTKEELLAHRDEIHIARKLSKEQLKCRAQCDICYKILNNSGAALRRHRDRSSFEYRCKTCGERFMNRVRITNHFKLKHDLPEEIVCCGCEANFNSKEELAAHSETVHLPKRSPPDEKYRFVCEVCYFKFTTPRGLFNHQTRLTKAGKKFSCKDCGKSFRDAYGLTQHEKTHWKTECHLCPVKESSHAAYLKHMEAHRMPDKTIKCLLCGQCYKYPQTLRIHYQSHAGERPYSCPQCPRTFLRQIQLSNHLKVHLGQKDQVCPHCDAAFVDPTNLARHIKFRHFKERPLTCLFCSKTFQKGHDRKRHMMQKHPEEFTASSAKQEADDGRAKPEPDEGQ